MTLPNALVPAAHDAARLLRDVATGTRTVAEVQSELVDLEARLRMVVGPGLSVETVAALVPAELVSATHLIATTPDLVRTLIRAWPRLTVAEPAGPTDLTDTVHSAWSRQLDDAAERGVGAALALLTAPGRAVSAAAVATEDHAEKLALDQLRVAYQPDLLGGSDLTVIGTSPMCPQCLIELLVLLSSYPRLAGTVRIWGPAVVDTDVSADAQGPAVLVTEATTDQSTTMEEESAMMPTDPIPAIDLMDVPAEVDVDEGEYDQDLMDMVEELFAAEARSTVDDYVDLPMFVDVDEGEYDQELLDVVQEMLADEQSTMDPALVRSLRQLGDADEPLPVPEPLPVRVPRGIPDLAFVSTSEPEPEPEPTPEPEPEPELPEVIDIDEGEYDAELMDLVQELMGETPSTPTPVDTEVPAVVSTQPAPDLVAQLVQSARGLVANLAEFTVAADRAQADQNNATMQRLLVRLEDRYDAVDRAGIDLATVTDEVLDREPSADGWPADMWELAVARAFLRGTRLSIARQVVSVSGRQLVDAFARLRVAEPATPEGDLEVVRREWQALLQSAGEQGAALATVTLSSGAVLSAMTTTGEESLVRAYVGGLPDSSQGRLPRYVAYQVGGDAPSRHADAEKKLFDYLVTNHEEELDGLRNAVVTLTTTEGVCPSCVLVALQFLTDFERLVVTVRMSGHGDPTARARRWFRASRA